MRARILYGCNAVAWGWLAIETDVSPASTILFPCAGLVLWTFLEYAIHRWCLHGNPDGYRFITPIALWHTAHHVDPLDPLHRRIPLSLSLPLLVMAYGLLYLLLGHMLTAGLFTSGLGLGVLSYNMTHDFLHASTPTSRLGRTMRRYHMIHHFAEPNHGFGVTSPAWDFILGTRPHSRVPLIAVKGRTRQLTGSRRP